MPGMKPNRIVVPFAVKAESIDPNARTFEGLASVWGLDLGDDVMHKGAFKNTLAEWEKSPDAIPLLNSHNHFDVMSAVGQMLEAKETSGGLWTKWEVIDGPDGDAVLARLRPSARTGRSPVSKMSIGYEPVKYDMEKSDQARFGEIRNLREVSLKEVSLVLFPMAPGARIDTETVKGWVDVVSASEGQEFSMEVKQEARRLASKLGAIVIASTRKSDDDGAPGAPPVPPAAPPTAPSAPPASLPATPPAPPNDQPPPPPPPAPAVVPPASPPPAPAANPAPTEKAEDVYLYAEPLQQRLRRIQHHSLIHRTGVVQ